MKSVSILGVLIGAVVDILSSIVLGLPFGIYALSKVDLAHTPKDQIQPAIAAAIHGNIIIHVSQLFVGICCSILGGYIAALIAKRMEVLNGTLSSFLCVSMGIYTMIAGKGFESLPVQILLLVVSPLMGLLGGYLRLRHIRLRPQSAI